MRAFIRVVLALLAAAPAAAGAQAADMSIVRQEVESLHREMTAALKRDPASVARFYTDQARVLGGGSRYTGREQIDKYWAGAGMFTDWKLDVVDVGGHPSAPWVLGRSTLTSRSGRSMTVDYVGVLQRGSDGKLRYHIDIFTAVPAGG